MAVARRLRRERRAAGGVGEAPAAQRDADAVGGSGQGGGGHAEKFWKLKGQTKGLSWRPFRAGSDRATFLGIGAGVAAAQEIGE